VERALASPNGLLAAGGDLEPGRLLAGYRHGIFPWYSEGDPILWWSPDPRMVLMPAEIRVSRSLAKTLRNRAYEVRFDFDFAAIIAACAAPRADGAGTLTAGTWITRPMQEAYRRLHELGYAHSVETWMDGELAGGLYGVALGRVFYGESMFSHRNDASKIALVALARCLQRAGFGLIDCQMHTEHLATLGARPIPRAEFVHLLAKWGDNLVDYEVASREKAEGGQGKPLPATPGSWSRASFVNPGRAAPPDTVA
jgi:leucyl/phenylalanyl-tRNA--protein transferase